MQETVENEVVMGSSNSQKGDDEIKNQNSVLEKIAGLYASHLLSDIILIVGENKYPAHRVILSASSDVFQCMLLNPQWQESKESTITLIEDPQNCRVFPSFLKYLYTGQVRVSIDSAMPLLSLADKYNIQDLIVLSRDYMLRNVALAGRQGYLISWLQYTVSFNYHSHLSNELKTFLRLNIDIVGYSRDFENLDPNNLVVLLQQNDLVIKNEAALFNIVERYLMAKKDQIEQEESLSDEEKGNHMKNLIEGICLHIRFPMMTVSELASIPLKPITNYHKQFFCERMAVGMSFHANHNHNLEADDLQWTPRLYTADLFSQEIKVEEIHTVENYKNYVACFFTLADFPYNGNETDENTIQWEVEFFPRGIRFNRAQMINVYHAPLPSHGPTEVPEQILKTVRVHCNCRGHFTDEIYQRRFKIAVLVSGVQNNVEHIKSSHIRTAYFSRDNRGINFNSVIPYDELSTDRSVYLIGSNHDTVKIQVVIVPMNTDDVRDSPNFDFK